MVCHYVTIYTPAQLTNTPLFYLNPRIDPMKTVTEEEEHNIDTPELAQLIYS
jgi:hypothetical protein